MLRSAAALREPDYQNDQGKYQQQMNGAAEGVTADHSQGPHQKQNEKIPSIKTILSN